MRFLSEKSVLRGNVLVPASKSHTIRAVAISTLAAGRSIIHHPLVSADCLASVNAGCLFGAGIQTGECWVVEGVNGKPHVPDNVVDVKNSGTSMNFFMGTAGLVSGISVLSGDEQIVRRPVQPLVDALNDLGAEVLSTRNNGRPPVVVKGPLKGGKTRFSAIVSTYLSSLLINCPLAEQDAEIEVYELPEKSYINMTLEWLDRQGIRYEASDNYDYFRLFGGQSYHGQEVTIPGDFSSATFFLVAGAIMDGDITLQGLDMNDSQGDKQVISYLKEMGAQITVEENGIRVQGGSLRGVDLDMSDTPDALPAMAVAGCFARGKTTIRNVASARLKETDRISVMAKELGRLGAGIEELPDGLIIHESALHGGAVQSYGDHRVVMSLAVAGMAIPGQTVVDRAEAVEVTVPNFVALMRKIGGRIRMET
jgi:3-phosphoshikimate 1-carboxyvinyltransferase